MIKSAILITLLAAASLALGQDTQTATTCEQNLKGFWREKDAREAIALFKKLQPAVARNDRRAVAETVFYPLRVSGTYRVHNRTAFLRNYDRIFDEKVRAAVAKQVPECINGNWRGFFTALGEVWIEALNDGPMKVIAVNSESWPKAPFRIKK